MFPAVSYPESKLLPLEIANSNIIERASITWGDVNTELYDEIKTFLTITSECLYKRQLQCYVFSRINVYRMYDDIANLKFFIVYSTWVITFQSSWLSHSHLNWGGKNYLSFYFKKLKSNVITHYDTFFHFSNIGFKRLLK
jgi:hypothetical protein